MTRNSKTLVTGGLLGLAGLGLLPKAAEAQTPDTALEVDPAAGAAVAENPHPVAVPEPAAQTSPPQVDPDDAPPPVWSPALDQTAPPPEPVALAPKPDPAPAAKAAPLAASLSLAAAAEKPESTPAPEQRAVASTDEATPRIADAPTASAAAPMSAAAPIASPTPEPEAMPPTPEPGPAAPRAAAVSVASAAPTQPSPHPTRKPSAAGSQQAVANLPMAADHPSAPAIAPLDHPKPAVASSVVPMPAAPTAADAMPEARILRPAVDRSATPPAAARARAEASPLPPDDGLAPATAPISRDDQPQRLVAAETAPNVSRQSVSAAAIAARIERSNAVVQAPIPQVSSPREASREPQLPVLSPEPVAVRPQAQPQAEASGAIAQPSPPESATATQTAPASTAGPQLPPLSPRVATIAPVSPHPKPALSPRRVELPAFVTRTSPSHVAPATPNGRRAQRSQPSTSAADLIAQAPTGLAQAPGDDPTAEQIRQDLRVDPLTVPGTPPRTYPPSPNAGIPSAFGAEWGDVFASATLAGADRVRPEADGSLSVGLGLGDAQSLVGVELAYNILSIRRFARNGNFDAKVHRQVYRDDQTQVAAALGWNNFARYGSNAVSTESSPYGVVSAAHLLQPDHPTNRLPITGTLGLGGGDFSTDTSDVGVIAGVGLQVHPQMSVNAAWSGVGLNVGTSLVISPTVPLTLTMTYGDITNNTAAGSVAVVTLGYGFRASPRF